MAVGFGRAVAAALAGGLTGLGEAAVRRDEKRDEQSKLVYANAVKDADALKERRQALIDASIEERKKVRALMTTNLNGKRLTEPEALAVVKRADALGIENPEDVLEKYNITSGDDATIVNVPGKTRKVEVQTEGLIAEGRGRTIFGDDREAVTSQAQDLLRATGRDLEFEMPADREVTGVSFDRKIEQEDKFRLLTAKEVEERNLDPNNTYQVNVSNNKVTKLDTGKSDSYRILTPAEIAERGLNKDKIYQLNVEENKVDEIGDVDGSYTMGAIPAGWYAVDVELPDGKVVPVMYPISGGEAAKEIAEAEAKKGMKAEGVLAKSSLVLGTIDEMYSLIEKDPDIVGTFTASAGSTVYNLTGLPVAPNRLALDTKIQTVRSNIGFDRLQQMREESPTGGALGQVAVRELTDLQASIAAMNPDLTREEFELNLSKIRDNYIAVAQRYANHFSVEELKAYGFEAFIPLKTVDEEDKPKPKEEEEDTTVTTSQEEDDTTETTEETTQAPEPTQEEEEFDLSKLPQEVQELWEFIPDEEKREFGWTGQ